MSARFIRQLVSWLLGGEPQASFVHAAGRLSAVRLGGGLALFLSQVLLARWMGRESFGIYSYAWAWVAILAPLSTLGLGGASVRFLANYRVEGDNARVRGLLRFTTIVTLVTASVVAVVGVVLVALAARDSPYRAALQVAFPATPALALLALDAAFARGFNWMATSAVAEQLGRPIVLILLGWLWVGIAGNAPAPTWVALCAAAYVLAALGQHLVVRRKISLRVGHGAPQHETTAWLRVSLALLLLTAAQMIRANTDLILVGTLLGPVEAGVYTAAVRAATLVSFVLTVSSVAAQPLMAAMHAQGRQEDLRRFVTSSARSILLVSLAIGAPLVAFGRQVLELFGSGFASAYPALAVLVAGHVAAAASGPLTSLLTMTGHHGRAAAVHGVSTLTNAALVVMLVPRLGIIGAALATSLNLALTQFALFVVTQRPRVEAGAALL